MARTDNLTNFLTDVSTAIKTKKGDNTPIKASNFDTEIANLPSGGGDTNYNVCFDASLGTNSIVKGITEINMIDTSNTTSFSEFFRYLENVVNFPAINTSKGTSFSYMFEGCKKMVESPYIDTSFGTNFTNMYRNCSVLKKIPLIDTSKGTSFSQMFAYDYKLTDVPALDTSLGTNFSQMFQNCEAMTEAPRLNTSKATNLSQIYSGCKGMKTMPELDCGSATNVYAMTINCSVLEHCGGFKDVGKAFSTTTSANNSNYSLSFTNTIMLTEESVINILNGLYDIKTKGCNVQKCTLGTNNLRRLTSEEGQQALANATEKGWTVS